MESRFEYLPPEKRKKIVFISDDLRVHSGIATVAREIVIHIAHHFNWVSVGGAVKHNEEGKRLDLSKSTNDVNGLEDSSVIMYPVSGYGNPEFLRQLIEFEKPDAIMMITDPRYYVWLFQMENEVRRKIPIAYLNIWDDYPAPLYNKPYYEACDLLMGISKQTVNINKLVLEGKNKNRIFKYVPHGLNEKIYFPIDKNDKGYKEFKKSVFKDKNPEFVVFFNSRNIRRKQIPDAMLAFRTFLDSLSKEKAKNCYFILHTELVTDPGTDLQAVKEYIFGEEYEDNVIFSLNKLSQQQLNYFYNMADVQILLTSNEGWGLSITEAILSGTPIIANVTGGMQDQMRFEDEEGNWFTPNTDIPSNHTGKYKKHGEWAFPVFPSSRTLVGSPQTPYIWDDTCNPEDAAKQIMNVYSLTKEERQSKGLKGREWALGDEAGFTSKHQGDRVIDALTELFDTWEPREKYELINVNTYPDRVINHKLLY